MAATITTAGLEHIADRAANGLTLEIDQMVFAYIDGLDTSATPPASETMPAPGDIVHQADLTAIAKNGDDTVVYSKFLGTDVGDFAFNWIGLYDSVHDVLIGVSYVPDQSKTASAGSTTGNSLTKNFAIQYTNIASIAGVTIDAATWQLDITAELDAMDDAISGFEADLASLIAALPAALNATNTIGQVIWYPASIPPANFLECAGQVISRTTYADLFGVIGITFGAGDGATTFQLPDLRGEFIRGWDHGRGIDAGRTIGSVQLDALQTITGTIIVPQDPSGGVVPHTGAFEVGEAVTSDRATAGGTGDEEVTFDSSRVTRGANETRPRNIALMACIRYAGGPSEIEFPDVTGPTGPAGNTILTTSGAPDDALGADGDYAIDPVAKQLYGPKAAGTWPAGVTIGGDPGADGNTILPTSGAPDDGIGANGDFALDPAAKMLYGPKAAGTWPAGVSIGGSPGADGNTILTTSGAPDDGLGANGDYALDPAAKMLYGPKAAGTWPAGVSIGGIPGADGLNGTPDHYFRGGTGKPCDTADHPVSTPAQVSADAIDPAKDIWIFNEGPESGRLLGQIRPATGVANIIIETVFRAQTAPSGDKSGQLKLHFRAANSGGAWSSYTPDPLTLTDGETTWQAVDEQTIAIGTFGLTAGVIYDLAVTRDPAGDDLVDALYVASINVRWE